MQHKAGTDDTNEIQRHRTKTKMEKATCNVKLLFIDMPIMCVYVNETTIIKIIIA